MPTNAAGQAHITAPIPVAGTHAGKHLRLCFKMMRGQGVAQMPQEQSAIATDAQRLAQPLTRMEVER